MTTSALGARLAGQDRIDAAGGGRPGGTRPLVLAGAAAACTAAGVGLATVTVLVLAGWITAPHPGLGLTGVVRTAAVLWLVGHHVTVQVAGAGRIGMLPLGLVLLPGALLWRAGRSVVRGGHAVTGPRQALAAGLSVAVPYAVLAGALAIGSQSRLAAASVSQAVLAGFVIALVAAGFGSARAMAPWAQLGTLMSPRTRSLLVGMTGSLAVLTGAGAMTTAFALASDVGQFRAVYRLLDPGVIGAGLLLLGQFAYLPNAVIWAIAYMLGPGFAVGAGTVVAPTGSVLGPLPALPLLAALPGGSHGSGPGLLGAVLLGIPYLAGAVGGLLAVRVAPAAVLETAPIRGFTCGALTGAVLGVATAFAGGPLGDGRLAAVGPSAWQVALVTTLEVGIAAAVTAGAANWWSARARWNAQAAAMSPAAPGTGHGTKPVYGTPGRDAGADPAAAGDGHVIYLDRWAADQPEKDPPRRPGGPSALP